MKKFWTWIVKHKVASIMIASVVVVGTTCAVVIPLATRHKHDFGSALRYDETYHWYQCECGEVHDKTEHGKGIRLKYDEEHHWPVCICGLKRESEPHVYDQEVKSEDYLKNPASRYENAVYYKSCKCGAKGTETFESEKLDAALTAEITGKTYDGKSVEFSYQTKSSGKVTTSFKRYDSSQDIWYDIGKDKPKEVGKYQLVVQVEETNVYKGETVTKDFEISKRQLTGLIELNIRYGDTIKISGRQNYYYEVTLTGTEYGLIEGESVRVRAIYDSQNAGTECTLWELFEENTYEKGTLELVGTTISAIEVTVHQDFALTPYQTEYAYTLQPSDGVILGETVVLRVEFESAEVGAEVVSQKLYIGGVEAINYVLSESTTLNLIEPVL